MRLSFDGKAFAYDFVTPDFRSFSEAMIMTTRLQVFTQRCEAVVAMVHDGTGFDGSVRSTSTTWLSVGMV